MEDMELDEGFEWDPTKAEANFKKHGVTFDLAFDLFLSPYLMRFDERKNYGEERRIAIGIVEGIILHVVFTLRAKKIRIISARRANKQEREAYHGNIKSRAVEDSNEHEG
jgi:uncharacterized protein